MSVSGNDGNNPFQYYDKTPYLDDNAFEGAAPSSPPNSTDSSATNSPLSSSTPRTVSWPSSNRDSPIVEHSVALIKPESRLFDKMGYIPLLSLVSGSLRIVGNLFKLLANAAAAAASKVVGLGYKPASEYSGKRIKDCGVALKRMVRGVVELTQVGGLFLYFKEKKQPDIIQTPTRITEAPTRSNTPTQDL